MFSFNKKPLTWFDASSPTKMRQSIQTFLLQGDADVVLRWLERHNDAVDDALVQYVWTQSIRNNQTEMFYPWLQSRHPEQLAQLQTDTNVFPLLTSPRAWTALKALHLTPSMDMPQIVHFTATWSDQLKRNAKHMQDPQFRKERGAYFNECAAIQLDMLAHCVRSYRARATLLTEPIRHYAAPDEGLTYEGTSNVKFQMHRAYARAMLQGPNPNVWMLVALEKKQAETAYYLSCSPKVSAWWRPFLERVFHKTYDKFWWQKELPKTTDELPQSLAIAASLADASTQIRHISSMLNFVDIETPAVPTLSLDIPSGALDPE